jgi:hypothetical protein
MLQQTRLLVNFIWIENSNGSQIQSGRALVPISRGSGRTENPFSVDEEANEDQDRRYH